MRKIFGALAGLALLAGCATTNTKVQEIPTVTGVYNLLTVEGAPLPHRLVRGELEGREITGGTLYLKADKSFELRTTLRVQMSSVEPFTFQREYTGIYDTSPIGVQFNWRAGRVTSGAFVGNTLKLYFSGAEFIFAK